MSVELLGERVTKTAEESLEDSMEAFRDAHRANTDQIMNIHEGKKKNSPRVYVRQPFPTTCYHQDGRELIAFSQEEVDSLKERGFRHAEPYIRARIAVLSPAEEKASADKRFREQEELIRGLSDSLARLQIAQDQPKRNKQ